MSREMRLDVEIARITAAVEHKVLAENIIIDMALSIAKERQVYETLQTEHNQQKAHNLDLESDLEEMRRRVESLQNEMERVKRRNIELEQLNSNMNEKITQQSLDHENLSHAYAFNVEELRKIRNLQHDAELLKRAEQAKSSMSLKTVKNEADLEEPVYASSSSTLSRGAARMTRSSPFRTPYPTPSSSGSQPRQPTPGPSSRSASALSRASTQQYALLSSPPTRPSSPAKISHGNIMQEKRKRKDSDSSSDDDRTTRTSKRKKSKSGPLTRSKSTGKK